MVNQTLILKTMTALETVKTKRILTIKYTECIKKKRYLSAEIIKNLMLKVCQKQ